MEISEFDSFIVTIKNSIPPELCKSIIKRFEEDDRRIKGVVGDGYHPETKQSTDLHITDLDGWDDIDSELYEILTSDLQKYMDYINPLTDDVNFIQRPIHDKGYQIQKTEPGGFYHWHNDESDEPHQSRWLTYLWYLNDVEEGYTEFRNGEKIYPEEGKLLLFPATWTYQHRGTPPKSVKYICTGWMIEETHMR